MSIFFSNAKIAAACGGIIYFVTYMPYVFISVQEGGSSHEDIGFGFKSLASLFSTTAFGLGARYFASFEQSGIGVQWSNLATSLVGVYSTTTALSSTIIFFCIVNILFAFMQLTISITCMHATNISNGYTVAA